MRISPLLAGVALLAGAPLVARADGCTLALEATDMMQFSTQRLSVPAGCPEVELTLRHTGAAGAGSMLHNWVLVRRADLAPVAAAGLRAGREHDYQPPADPRVLAATPIISGGQSSTIRFATGALRSGESYAFFCSTPGHNVIMRGELRLESTSVASNAAP
jgi:azurin